MEFREEEEDGTGYTLQLSDTFRAVLILTPMISWPLRSSVSFS